MKLNRHYKLGKIHYTKEGDLKIVNIPFDVTYQTDTFLLLIIRDYLINFINDSPVAGNCVLPKEYKDIDKYETKWTDLVNDIANEFNVLYKMYKTEEWCSNKWNRLKDKVFKDLSFIFNDLNW